MYKKDGSNCHRGRLAATVAAALLLAAAGCSTAAPGRLDRQPTHLGAVPAPALQASFAELAGTIPATIGIAIAPVGASRVTTFGAWSDGVAWSTIKVPLAIAALRVHRPDANALVVKAITQSDNTAAERLWSQLGSPGQAAHRVQAVLTDGGDATTVVESRRLRPGFTAFGQTQWPLRSQAEFAAHLPCLAGTGTVVDLMQHLVESQRWGLAADAATAAKGGWGPGQTGGYLVRQFGILSVPAGKLAVALAAEPHAGTLEKGVDALNRMTQWLTSHAAELPGGHCAE